MTALQLVIGGAANFFCGGVKTARRAQTRLPLATGFWDRHTKRVREKMIPVEITRDQGEDGQEMAEQSWK